MIPKPVFLLLLSLSLLSQLSAVRHVEILRDGWRFQKGPALGAEQPGFDDSNWEVVSVPHDWAIYGPFDKEIDKQVVAIRQNMERVPREKTGRTGALPHVGEGWYRKEFTLPEFSKGKRAILQFEGAMSEPEVFLNGKQIGKWNYGYGYFYLDITYNLEKGKDAINTLAVHLDNKGFASRWYPGAGLYRKVTITIKDEASIDHWGVGITTPEVTDEAATVNITTEITGRNLTLETQIIDAAGQIVATQTTEAPDYSTTEQNITLPHPSLWSPESPYLYTAVSILREGDEIKDRLETRFGVRTIEYIPEKGFFLNGQNRKFKGVCLHHDLGPLGAAVNIAALRRQMRILKDMGCDSIRSAHNMPSLEQLDLADEMGFLFLAESFDEWKRPKVENGYNRFFQQDAEQDIVNLVRATRNHPSIVMWSSGNEVPDQSSSDGPKLAKYLQDIFHREDPQNRPVTVGMDDVRNVMKNGFGAIIDVPGLNYRVHLYEEAYATFPQKILLGSETASTVSSRGVYKFPVERHRKKEYPDLQSSSYDFEYTPWSNLPEKDFIMQDDKPWVIGEFVWTGFDYLGEPTPYDHYWPSRSSYFGICDLAGLPKDRYYLYRSRWNTEDDTLHILPHWNWPDRVGKVTPVFVYTNYNQAELFLNGRSLGIQRKTKDKTPQHRYRLMWEDVIYEPGTLEVVALDDAGNEAGRAQMHTAGPPARLMLEADRTTIHADGEDIAFITVSAVDASGNPAPLADNQLRFTVEGAARYRAACNGDATSLEMFHEPTMKLFSGKLVVLVQATKEAGSSTLTVSADGLPDSTIDIQSIL